MLLLELETNEVFFVGTSSVIVKLQTSRRFACSSNGIAVFVHNCCVFELNVAGATLLEEADVDSLLGNAKVRIKYQEVCGNFI